MGNNNNQISQDENSKSEMLVDEVSAPKMFAIPITLDGKGSNKAYFCPFCFNNQKKFYRHLKISTFMDFKIGSAERRELRSNLRKNGSSNL